VLAQTGLPEMMGTRTPQKQSLSCGNRRESLKRSCYYVTL
jgi:hypothetical protein